ncbi:MAG: LLM class flavin-dependent oxidoreductase [Ilumatobacteraceae bacterium]
MVAIGDEFAGEGANRVLDFARPNVALYVGGMGARDKNFYNTICQKYGYVDEAIEIQDLYLSGQKEEAAAKVPQEMLANTNLVGPASYVKERIAAYEEAGVTHLAVTPIGDPTKTIEQLRDHGLNARTLSPWQTSPSRPTTPPRRRTRPTRPTVRCPSRRTRRRWRRTSSASPTTVATRSRPAAARADSPARPWRARCSRCRRSSRGPRRTTSR